MTARAPVAVSAAALALRAELGKGMRPIAMLGLGDRSVDVRAGHDSLWAIIRRGDGPDRGWHCLAARPLLGGCARIRRTRKPRSALLADS
jgi:hypothetical protein